MSDFIMTRDRKLTGLDFTEFIPKPPSSWKHTKPVIACGVIEVDDVSWFTAKGKETVQSDCARRQSRLDLAQLYKDRKTVRLRVRFTMGPTPATFMNSTKQEDSVLKIHWSLDKQSSTRLPPFLITDFNFQTAPLCRNFLHRYCILSFMMHLKETDPDTPLEDRHIGYFASKYIESRDDEDEESYVFRNIFEDPPRNAPRPGHHRHISPADVKLVFGLQADWLLAQALESWDGGKGKFLYIPKWVEFCREVRLKRRSPGGLRWCSFSQHEDETDGDIEEDERYLAKYGADEDYWKGRLESRINAATRSRSGPKKSHARPVGRRGDASNFNYDENFSDASSEDDTGSDCEVVWQPDRDLSSRIHPRTLHELRIPTGRRWCCPVPQCRRTITLAQIRETAARRYPDLAWQDASWPDLEAFFRAAVDQHYAHHWYNAGVSVRKTKELYLESTGRGLPYRPPPQETLVPGLKEEEEG